MANPPLDATKPLPAEALPGGGYQYVANGDGTFNVLDVPILAEIPAGAFPFPPNKEAIDRKWMERAITKAKQREGEGHLGAVHIHHHGGSGDVKAAGRLQLTRVGKVVYDGREQDALFANLLRIPRDAFDEMKAGNLPYRSIEGEPWDKCEIVSLAIMPTETPYFRLPMLTIGGPAGNAYLSIYRNKTYAVACSAGGGFSVLSHFVGEPQMPEPEVKAEAPKPLPAEQSNPQAAPAQPAQAQQQDQKPPDDKKPEASNDKKAKGGGITEKMKNLFAMMMGLVMEALGEEENKDPMDQRKEDKAPPEQNTAAAQPVEVKAAAPVSAPAPEKPADPVKAEAPAPVAAVKLPDDLVALQVQNAELVAKLAVLEGKVQAQAVVDQVAIDVAEAKKALAGCNITPAIEDLLVSQRKAGGKACLEACVKVFAQAALKDPPTTLEAATTPSSAAAGAVPSGDDAILNKLGPQPPETMTRAHVLLDQAKAYCAKFGDGVSPEEFVRYNLRAEGLLKA